MPKKQKVNAYFLFMQELRTKRPEWSRKSNQDLMNLASPLWDELSPEQKDVYTKRAKELRGLDENNPSGGPMDSHGRSLKDIKKRDEEERLLDQKKIQDVDDFISREAANLEDVSFFVIHTHIFAKSEMGKDAIFVPAEICLSRFSLRAGLTGVYQSFPAPDPPGSPIPAGEKRACMQQSDKIQIPLQFEDPAGSTTEDLVVLREIRSFLAGTEMVFTMPDCEEQCSGVLDRIAQRSGQPGLGLRFLSLSRLLFNLKTVRCQTEEEAVARCPSERIALRELERERFLYWPGLSCVWHEEHTETALCSQATVARWIFTILDNCCPLYNIALVPGRHAPQKLPPIKTEIWSGLSGARRKTGTSGGVSLVKKNGWSMVQDIRYKEDTLEDSEQLKDGRGAQQEVRSIAEQLANMEVAPLSPAGRGRGRGRLVKDLKDKRGL